MTDNKLRGLTADCARSAGEDIRALSPLTKANLLITGGTGFAGTWLTEMVAFLNDHHGFGIRLTLLAPHPELFEQRAPHLASRSDVQLLRGNVLNLVDLPAETEWVIHAAASPDSRSHFSNPIQTIETIVDGTRAVLSAASRLSLIRRVLCLSSGLVYGPQRWEDAAIGDKAFSGLDCASPANLYAESKRAAETVAAAFRSQTGLSVLSARMFAFIGPYQSLERPWAVNNFLADALRGGPIRVQGRGDTVRSYLYGSDMADWLLRILVSGKQTSAYNVGSPDGVALRDLAVRIAENSMNRPGIELNTLPMANQRATRWIPDISNTTADCGVRVRTSLDEAIQRTVAWHSSRLTQPTGN